MKITLLLPLVIFFRITAIAQNTFPSSGNVGIGTTPTNILTVRGAATFEENIVNITNLSDQDFAIKLSAPGAATKRTIIGPTTLNRFSLGVGVNSNEHLTIINGGNIGIGTTSPSTLLHLNNGAPSGVQGLNGLTKLTVDAASGGFAEFRNSADNNTYTGLLFTDNNLGGYVAFRNYPDDKLHLGAYGGIAFEVGTDNNVAGKAERLRIDPNGLVGIGTTTPSARFHINSNVFDETLLNITAARTYSVLNNFNPFVAINPTLTDNNTGNNTRIRVLAVSPSITHTVAMSGANDLVGIFPSFTASGSGVDVGSANMLNIAPAFSSQRNIGAGVRGLYINPSQ